jgi:dienelactone hydrolase
MRGKSMKLGWIAGLALWGTWAASAQGAGASAHVLRISQTPTPETLTFSVQLLFPHGAKPWPAVVLLHGCTGTGDAALRAWAARLRDWGYLVALPDSYAPRSIGKGACADGAVPELERAKDAYATLHALEARPDVAPTRVGVLGQGHGGTAVLTALSDKMGNRAWYLVDARHRFSAGIALSPGCGPPLAPPYAYSATDPLLILAGAADDWMPAGLCEVLVRTAPQHPGTIALTVYPGARHGFDGGAPLTRVREALQGRGATVAGQAAARKAAIASVKAFLAERLASKSD